MGECHGNNRAFLTCLLTYWSMCNRFLIYEWNIWLLLILISWVYCLEESRARIIQSLQEQFCIFTCKIINKRRLFAPKLLSNLSSMILRHQSTRCSFSLSEKGFIPQLTTRIRDITPKAQKPCSTLSFQQGSLLLTSSYIALEKEEIFKWTVN